MDSVDMSSNGDCIVDCTAEVLLPSESEHPNRYNVFGEPEVLPRVGNDYQAEIPDLIFGPDYNQLKLDPFDESVGCGPRLFHMGLPISVMWVSIGHDKVKHEQQESVDGACDPSIKMDSQQLDPKIKHEESGSSVSREEIVTEAQQGCFAVPGSHYSLWNDSEEANFLLGLYTFGKNLIQVKKFMENKSMGEVMSFYYGKFYGSSKYRRWSMCRKMKSRKCIYGQKIFSGLRQTELLDRLIGQVDNIELSCKIVDATRAFNQGRTSLEEYVFALKALVGVTILVQAVGIGKGKQDLTGIGSEHAKPSNYTTICPEIPIGKACSALTTAEIVTFLTGNFRLSKARSNDLFWEAVWPRLLARGWHSEQPENGIAAGSRHALVFLVPGVKKFSKRKLVKGDHYFDSVTDVLNTVASQPGLLDLDAVHGESTGNGGGEIPWTSEAKSDGEESPDEERRCYLKPRTPTQSGDGIKFTVVDTSMAVNGRGSKLRELRSLPPDISSPSFRSHVEEDTGDVGSNSGDDSSNISTEEFGMSKAGKANNGEKRIGYQYKKATEFPPKQRTKPKIRKRQKMDVSNCAMRSCSRDEVSAVTRFEQEAASCCSSNPSHRAGDVSGNGNVLHVGPSPETLSSTNSPSKDVIVENLHAPWSAIDLNLPVNPDAAEFTNHGAQTDDAPLHSQPKPPPHDSNAATGSPSSHPPDNADHQPNNGRRQSTRNRPLTTKALEALAFGLFDTKRKRKSRDAFPYEMASRLAPRRAPGRSHPDRDGESYSADFVDLGAEDKGSYDRGSESMLNEQISSGFSL